MTSRLIQRRIGGILKKLRTERGWSLAYAADQLDTTEKKLGHYERGDVDKIEPGLVENWARDLGAPEELQREVRRMARLTREGTTRWEIGVPAWFGTFVELESTAASIDIYDPELITGILQVLPYMEATVRVSALLDPGEADQVISVRQKRQDAVFGRDGGPPKMRVIINESALQRIQHEDFYDKQIQRLIEIGKLPGIEIDVLPISVGLHASVSTSYTILTFEDAADPEVVYTEDPGRPQYEADRETVAEFRRVFRATLDDTVAFEAWIRERRQ